MTTPPCTTDPEPFTSELTLDVTSLAQKVALAASVPDVRADSSVIIRTYVEAVIEVWEELTGLHGDDALALAVKIAADPQPVRAAVVPF